MSEPLVLAVTNNTKEHINVDLFADKHQNGIIVEQRALDNPRNIIDYSTFISGADKWKYVIGKVTIHASAPLIQMSTLIQKRFDSAGDGTSKTMVMQHFQRLEEVDSTFTETPCCFVAIKDYDQMAVSEWIFKIPATYKVVFKIYPQRKFRVIE